MFYVLSRFAAWLASPVLYIAIFLLISIWSRSKVLKTVFCTTGLLLMFLFSMQPFYLRTANSWIPEETLSLDSTKHYTYCLLPGGFSGLDTISRMIDYGDACDRLTNAVGLLKAGIVDTLVITGDGAVNKCRECFMAHLEEVFGIDTTHVMVEHKAKNTYQNFTNTIDMIGLEKLSGHTIVINSAMYMRRSILCADLVELDADFFSVDYSRTYSMGWADYVPQPTMYDKWLRLLHEIVGYWAYSLTYG